MTSLLHRPSTRVGRGAAVALVLLLAAPLGAGSADARAGGGFSFGSRGTRSYSAPAPTATAPRYVQPFQRSDTPSAAIAGSVNSPGRFGFGSGLMTGLLGAGLFGLFSGGGFFGGIAALVGLLFKLALVGGAIWLVLRLVRGRRTPALAGGPASFRQGPSVLPGGVGWATAAPAPSPQDYQVFERSLIDIQSAFSREDGAALSRLATPEMARTLTAELEANRRQGVRNDVSGARLVQGDLSETWRDGATTYASVAMRFEAVDVMIDRGSGRVVAGDPARPVQATEVWTFRRDPGQPWILSAIQQAG